jgi:hypothetical protein
MKIAGNRTKKIALMKAMTRESELTEEDIIALDPKVKEGIQKHYKSKVSRSTGRKADLSG